MGGANGDVGCMSGSTGAASPAGTGGGAGAGSGAASGGRAWPWERRVPAAVPTLGPCRVGFEYLQLNPLFSAVAADHDVSRMYGLQRNAGTQFFVEEDKLVFSTHVDDRRNRPIATGEDAFQFDVGHARGCGLRDIEACRFSEERCCRSRSNRSVEIEQRTRLCHRCLRWRGQCLAQPLERNPGDPRRAGAPTARFSPPQG